MTQSFYNNGLHISGWPGVFRNVKIKMSDGRYMAKRVDSAYGIISLYPHIKKREFYKSGYGWIGLDVFFQVYTDEKIADALKAPKGKPLLFWGSVDDRSIHNRSELEKFNYKIDIFGYAEDPSEGRISPTRAVLYSSSAKELSK